MKDILREFKTFALKGSVIDLSIGIIIGAAFNKIVNSLVSDIVMPPIGFILGRVDFEEFYINLGDKIYPSLSIAKEAGAPTINYGIFINALISFLITSIAVFFLIKIINKIRTKKHKNSELSPGTKECQFCLGQISEKASRCPNCTSYVITK